MARIDLLPADNPADLDAAIEPGAIDQWRVNRPRQQLLQIPTGKIQPPAGEHRFADFEALPDEVAERYADRREIAAMICGRKLDLLTRSRRITPRDCLEHFHFLSVTSRASGFGE